MYVNHSGNTSKMPWLWFIIFGLHLISVCWSRTCEKHNSTIFPVCFCDERCFTYRDCCFDVKIPENFSDIDEGRSAKCQRTYSKNYPTYWIVSECPFAVEDTYYGNILVAGSDTIVYKNPEIALCNNISHFVPLDLYLIPQERSQCIEETLVNILNLPLFNMSSAFQDLQCPITWYPKDETNTMITPRSCLLTFDYTSNFQRERCLFFQEPIRVDWGMYKNAHCYEDEKGVRPRKPFSFLESLHDPKKLDGKYVVKVRLPDKLHIEKGRTNADLICNSTNPNNCRTTQIKHWKQLLTFSLGTFSLESAIHPEVHVNMFLHNFLKNPLDIRIANTISMYVVSGYQNKTECSSIIISANVVSDDVMNYTMFKLHHLFLKQFSQVNFTSVSNGRQVLKVSNHRCNQEWNTSKPLQTRRFRAYTVEKLKSDFSGYDKDSISRNYSFCSDLVVSYKELVEPNQYSGIRIMDWKCAAEITSHQHIEKMTEEQDGKVIIIVSCIASLAVLLFLVLGCRFYLHNPRTNSHCMGI